MVYHGYIARAQWMMVDVTGQCPKPSATKWRSICSKKSWKEGRSSGRSRFLPLDSKWCNDSEVPEEFNNNIIQHLKTTILNLLA